MHSFQRQSRGSALLGASGTKNRDLPISKHLLEHLPRQLLFAAQISFAFPPRLSLGLFWLRQTAERNSIVRKLQVIKLRGQDSVPGLHTFRITDAGVQAFSRTFGLTARKRNPASNRRLCFGVPELDKMLDGGVREPGNLSWQPNSLRRAYATGNPESWLSLKNARKPMPSGPPV